MAKVSLKTSDIVTGYYVRANLHDTARRVDAIATAINDWEKFELVEFPDGFIALQAHNGQFVRADNGGGDDEPTTDDGHLFADRDDANAHEKFKVKPLSNGGIALQAANGKYWKAIGGGGGDLSATADVVDAWECFFLIRH